MQDGPQEVESLALYNGQRTLLMSVQKARARTPSRWSMASTTPCRRCANRPRRVAGDHRRQLRPIRVAVDNVRQTLIECAAHGADRVPVPELVAPTVITGLTLPIALIGTFLFMNMFGFTINMITLMALSLCVGLLIDDAIVVRENIVRHEMGKGSLPGGHGGHAGDRPGVLATTLSIVAVFRPSASWAASSASSSTSSASPSWRRC